MHLLDRNNILEPILMDTIALQIKPKAGGDIVNDVNNNLFSPVCEELGRISSDIEALIGCRPRFWAGAIIRQTHRFL